MKIELVRPMPEHKEQALEFKSEFFAFGEKVINGSEMLDTKGSYEEWLEHVRKNADPASVSSGWVVTDTYFAMDEAGKIVGIIDFRHELKGFLKDFGHCGYSVRPSERRKGIATDMLARILKLAEGIGIPSLQLSVERSNEASIKTILKNGGIFERSFDFNGETADVYRIPLS